MQRMSPGGLTLGVWRQSKHLKKEVPTKHKTVHPYKKKKGQ
jgi:hypothetical protein